MTKKDYILIAKAIKQTLKDLNFIENYQEIIKTAVIGNISGELYQQNYKFDKEKFIKSCGIENNKDKAKNITNELIKMYNNRA